MFGFGRKNRALLGIDISSTAIKLVELARTPGATAEPYHIVAFAVESLPVNAVVEKRIADVEVVGQAIQRAVLKSGTSAKRAAVAVSGSSVITKVITMADGLSDAEMETQIQLEADQYIPYPLEEVNIDFDVLGPSANGIDMVDVLLAASRRENVDDRVAALEIAGLTAEIVDVEAYAMENACALLLGDSSSELQEHTLAIADVGATTTTLHVMHNGSSVYTREQNFGSQQLLDEVQRRYGLPSDQALEQLNSGELPENYQTEVLGPFKEALAQQIARARQFFYSSTRFDHTDHIILAGGCARINEVDRLVEARLGCPASVADPFRHMSTASHIDTDALSQVAPAMMIAVGLALREFL
jgi:type IV pilus assembly protein PilM